MASYGTGEWLKHATELLKSSGVPSARLDALILLEDITNKDRAFLLAHPEILINGNDLDKLENQLLRRSVHEPMAYIRGKSEFYGRSFYVTPATLQPRSETENIITLLKYLHVDKGSVVADIGTGSGCIAITAKLEIPSLVVHATEIQITSLAIAKKNASKLGADVTFYSGNLFEPLANTAIDVVLTNLPYVPSGHTINKAAMQEPAIAIFGGEDGLDLYRELFIQLDLLKQKPKYTIAEALPFQHKDLADIASGCGYTLKSTEDFIQLFELA